MNYNRPPSPKRDQYSELQQSQAQYVTISQPPPIRDSFLELQQRQAQNVTISQPPPVVVNEPPSPINLQRTYNVPPSPVNLQGATFNYDRSTIQQPAQSQQYQANFTGQTIQQSQRELEFLIQKRRDLGIATPRQYQPAESRQEIQEEPIQERILDPAPIAFENYQSVIEQTPPPYVSYQIPAETEEGQKFWDENQQQFQQPEVIDSREQIDLSQNSLQQSNQNPYLQQDQLIAEQDVIAQLEEDQQIVQETIAPYNEVREINAPYNLVEEIIAPNNEVREINALEEIVGPNNDQLFKQIGDLSQSVDQFQRQETQFYTDIDCLKSQLATTEANKQKFQFEINDLKKCHDLRCDEHEKEKENILKQVNQMKKDRDSLSKEVHVQLDIAKNMIQGNYLLTLLQFLGLIFVVLELRYVLTGNVLSPAQQMTPYAQNLYTQFEAKLTGLQKDIKEEEQLVEEEYEDHEE